MASSTGGSSPLRIVEPMGPNMVLENTDGAMLGGGMKRKAVEDEPVKRKAMAEGKENGDSGKRPKLQGSVPPAPLVELRDRKLVFRQDPLPPKYPKRLKLNFEGLLLDAEEAGRKVQEIPEELWGMVVLTGHEQSSGNETFLAKHIVQKLLEGRDDKDVLPSDIVKTLIPKLFAQRQYGLLPSDFPPSASGSVKVPAVLQIRCWEVLEPAKYFPEDQLEVLQARRAERVKAREQAVNILAGLDDVEKLEMLKGEKDEKTAVEASPQVELDRKSREGTAATTDSRRSASPVKKGKLTPEEEETVRLRREEKEARKAAREEKKAAKEKEIQKKEAVLAKQAQTMSMFFKPKTAASPSSLASSAPISRESPAGPSTVRPRIPEPTDFEKTFRPVPRRAHVVWADINRWVQSRRPSLVDGIESKGPPVEELARWGDAGARDVEGWTARDFIDDHLERTKHPARRVQSHLPKGLKSAPLHGTVGDVWAAHQEAADPRKVLNQLRSQKKFPWKTLAFDQQARPPYSGTFTKKSVVVGPRTPFAQDPVFDYSYDSGDDWEDEEGGEDVDDFGEGNAPPDEEDEDDDEEEGEFDDWLDDSEEGIAGIEGMMGVDDGPLFPAPASVMEQGRLPVKVVKKRDVPKKVTKLVPWWKGPEWEGKIGSGTAGLETYSIQLLNDTPAAVDPFKFTSSDAAQAFNGLFSSTVIGTNLKVPTLLSVEPIAASLEPPPVHTTTLTAPTSTASESATFRPGPNQPKSRATGPKVAFPSSHLAELLRLIDGNTKIQTDLVSQLKAHFDNVTSKTAIETKIREVATREGKAKDSRWTVRPEAWAAAGLDGPRGPGGSGVPMVTDV